MKEVRYFYCPDTEKCSSLPQEEAEHAIRVLRLQTGDEVLLTDGKGYIYQASITAATKKSCSYQIINKQAKPREWTGKIHLVVAPTKNMDRMEWLVEKATEIGFDSIHFINCQFSERKVINVERLERVAVSAMKQSHKAYKPIIAEMVDFKKFIEQEMSGQKYIAHCYNDADIDENLTKQFLPQLLGKADTENWVLIGPEGDFSVQEVKTSLQKGFLPISLGPCRLRTETAALLSVVMMNMNNINLNQE